MSGRTIRRAALIFLPLAVAAVVVSCLLYASQANAIRVTAQATERTIADIARQRIELSLASLAAARQLGMYWLLLNEGPPH